MITRMRFFDPRLRRESVHFDASDLQSFTKAFGAALSRLGPQYALELHVQHRDHWWVVTDPGATTTLLAVSGAALPDLERYWSGVQEALAFFARADAATAQRLRDHAARMRRVVPNPAFDMTLADAYRLMGLEFGASPEAVRSAYRTLTKQHHTDRGGSLEMMQRINVARDMIESGGKATTASSRPSAAPQDEPHWDARRDWWRAKPSDNYTVQDLRRVSDWVLAQGLRQVFHRQRVDFVPVDARIGANTYTRPFGGVARREKIPEDIAATVEGSDRLAGAFERYHPCDPIFDIGMSKDLAWITWSVRPRGYQSVSFERPVKRTPKPKGAGMTPIAADDVMRELGLHYIAGGVKYAYWSVPVPGRVEKTGIFVRTSKRTIRLVKRERRDTGIEDRPLDDEVYYGALTRAQLEEWAKTIRDRAGV